MRLTALDVERYGNLERVRLQLDPAPGRINVVVAPNGAGKSVLRQAFSDLLFGIPGQTPLGFRFHYRDMRLRAEAIGPDGPVRFGRRKGHGNTLLDEVDGPLAPAVLDRLLGRTDRVQLERLFALDTERLRAGGHELLASGGDLADALLSAAGGRHRAGAIRADMEQQRDAVAPERRSASRPFYKALDAWLGARKALREGVLRPEERGRREREWRAAQDDQAHANQEAADAAAALARLERARRVAPLLAKLDAAQAWLDAHPEAPVLPEGLRARLAEAREALHRARDKLGEAEARQAEAARRASEVVPDDTLLAAGDLVQTLAESLGAAQQAAADLPGAEAESRTSLRQVEIALRTLGSSLPVERAAEAVPPLAARRAARRLIERHGEIAALLESLPARIASVERGQTTARDRLAALPAATGTRGTTRLVNEIRDRGDPALQAASHEQARQRGKTDAARALADVPGWTAGIEALAVLAPLPLPIYEGLHEALQDVERALADRSRRAEEAANALSATVQETRADTGGDVPDEAVLAATRQHRDQGWQLVFRHAFTADPPHPTEIEAWTGGVPLPLAYERATVAADIAADRRVAEAERVQRAAERARTRQRQETELTFAQSALQEAQDLARQARANWAAAAAPLGLPAAATVASVREFVARRNAALDAEHKARDAADAATALAAQHAGWAASLATELGLEAGARGTGASLPDLLRDAALAEEARTERAVVEERLRTAQDQLVELRAEGASRGAELDAWRARWAEALAALHQAPDLRPEAAGDILDVLDQLEGALGHADRAAEQVRAMQASVVGFGEQVAATVRAAAPDLAGTDPFEAARALGVRLDLARKAAAQREERRRRLDDAGCEVAGAGQAATGAAAELRAVLAATGAEDEADAVRRIERAEARAQHEAARALAAAELHDAGDGQALAALRAEIAAVSPDERAAQREQAQRRQEDANTRAQEAAAQAARLGDGLAQDAVAVGAMHAAHAEASAAASLARVLEDAVLMQVAVALLDHGLQEVERGGDGPLVARIGSALQALTTGAYDGVVLRPDKDGKPRLMAVERAFPGEPRAVDELSEGTQDQLFLALRLVAIEDHLAVSPPLPFVADDILQTFDNARATAALRRLLDLSEQTQVVVLTHHEHVLDLAQSLPEGTVHVQSFGR